MNIEDIQPNLDRQRRTVQKKNRLTDINPDNLENIDALETVVNSRLASINSRLEKFLSENPIPNTKTLSAEFDNLRQIRHKIEIELVDLIDDFGNEGLVQIRETVGEKERVVKRRTMEIAGEKRKDDLKYKVVLSSFLHNLCDNLLKEICGSGRYDKGDMKNRGNERNISLAQMQQYLAMSIIRNPKENYPLFEESVERLKRIYNFPNQQSVSLEGGVLGLVGAYHFYQEQGYKVLFATPETDASKQTDLYIVAWGKLAQEGNKEKLAKEGIEEINNLPLTIRKEASKVQVKCHANKDRPTKEIIFDLMTNSAYASEANLRAGDKLYTIADYEYPDDEAHLFFKNQCSGLTNGRFLDIKMHDAKSYIREED
jgi:hypothetical protein